MIFITNDLTYHLFFAALHGLRRALLHLVYHISQTSASHPGHLFGVFAQKDAKSRRSGRHFRSQTRKNAAGRFHTGGAAC
jgi:hypothetical protein